ncbi:MAG: PAS domain S-box protein [Desulfosalsimonadaceae bacterium]
MTYSDSKDALLRRIKELEGEKQALHIRMKQYRRNEQRFQSLMQSSREGYFELNLQGELVFFNDAVCRILGYSRPELIGKNNREYTSADTARRMFEVFHRVYTTGESAEISDYEVIRKDGQVRFLELSAYLLLDESGAPTGFCGVGRDITDRKQTEQKLKESEERFRRLQDASFAATCIHEQGRIIECNSELSRMSGYTYDELIGMHAAKLCAPEWQKEWKKYVLVSEEAQYDLVGIDKHGVRVPVEVRSKSIPYYGRTVRAAELRDISRRKKTEEALRKSRVRYRQLYKEAQQAQELYQSLLNSSPDPISLLNPDQSVQYINRAFTNLFGWQDNELQTEPLPCIPKPFRSLFANMIEKLVQNGEPVHGREAQAVTRSGDFLDVSISAAPYLDYKGCLAGVLIIFRNITETRRYQWHMQQAQKMESIGAMAGGIAHDFNNLIMGMQGRLALALKEVSPEEPAHQHLKEIEEYASRAVDINRRLLDFSRNEKVEVAPADINELVRNQVSMFGRTCKAISMHEDPAEDLWCADVDRARVEQVLLNLFMNASQAMEDCGDIYIRTANEYLPEQRTRPHDLDPGSYIRISVADNGPGMDESVQRRVFEPFYTTKPRGQGTGLGLASAYNIIKNHGGFISLYSEKGRGSTFNIYLPASKQAAAAESPAEAGVVDGRGTILVVDDEEMIIEVAREMLESLGYDVISGKSGDEAVQRLSENPDTVDLVILDFVMPGMSGSEVLEQLKALKPEIKVLLASGYNFNGRADALMQRGCSGFIQKPFNLAELSRKLHEMLQDS